VARPLVHANHARHTYGVSLAWVVLEPFSHFLILIWCSCFHFHFLYFFKLLMCHVVIECCKMISLHQDQMA
jgi:hypothetical protein